MDQNELVPGQDALEGQEGVSSPDVAPTTLLPKTEEAAAPQAVPDPVIPNVDTISAPGGEDAEALLALKNLEKRRKLKARKKRLRIAGGIAAVALVAGFFGLRGMLAPSAEEEAYQPAVGIVERRDFTTTIQSSGALKPNDSVVVSPEVDGIIETVSVSAGQQVNIGDTLLTIRSSSVEKELSKAADDVASAQRGVTKAQNEVGKAVNEANEAYAEYSAAYDQSIADQEHAQAVYEEAYNKVMQPYRDAVEKAKEALTEAQKPRDAARENGWDVAAVGTPERTQYEELQKAAVAAYQEYQAKCAERDAAVDGAKEKAAEAMAEIEITAVPEYSDSAYTTQIEAAQEGVETAVESLDSANKAYTEVVEEANKRIVKAPKSGTIVAMNAVEGASVSSTSGTGSLVQIADLTKMKVSVEVNEIDISTVAPGQTATCKFSALPDLELKGRVVSVASVSSGSSDGEFGGGGGGVVTFTVDLVIDKPDPRLKPGMTTNVTIYTQDVPDALVVPAMALVEEGGETYVMRVTDPETFAAERCVVTVGERNSSDAVITSGLNEGDQVLLSASDAMMGGDMAGDMAADGEMVDMAVTTEG